jgi:hypothetical protein
VGGGAYGAASHFAFLAGISDRRFAMSVAGWWLSRVCVARAGLASCPAMGGAMSDRVIETDKGTTRKGNSREEITVSDEEIRNTMFEIFGADGGERFRDAPWELLRHGANYITFRSLALIVKVFDVELGRGNLGVIKLLLELVAQLAKQGSIQPAVMQSFAELLIKSLEAESLEAETREAQAVMEEAPVKVSGEDPRSENPDLGHPGG